MGTHYAESMLARSNARFYAVRVAHVLAKHLVVLYLGACAKISDLCGKTFQMEK